MTWSVLGASEVGSSHISANKGCEDAFSYRVRPDGSLIVAVADGAGSAKHAKRASEYLAPWTVELLDVALDHLTPSASQNELEDMVETVFLDSRERLEFLAAEVGLALKDLASTLVVFVGLSDRSVAAQVGDGAVVVRLEDGSIHGLLLPARAEFLNETVFLTSDDAFASLSRASTPSDVTHVAVMTDGLQLVALDLARHEPHVGFFQPIFQFASNDASTQDALCAFLRSDRVAERTDDDKTIVLGRKHR